jgi:hypothetical protein
MASILGTLMEQRFEWDEILRWTYEELKKFPDSSATQRRIDRLESDLKRLDQRILGFMLNND